MATPNPSDETLMAYADGQLTPDETREIERLVAADPALQRRVEMYRQSAALVKQAVAPIADEAVPDVLKVAVAGMVENAQTQSNVVAFRPRATPETPRRFGQMAIAASLAALIGGIAGYSLNGGGIGEFELAVGRQVPQNLATLLSTVPSGAENKVDGHVVRLVSTFKLPDQALCREFEAAGGTEGAIVAVACREGGTWTARFAVAAAPATDGYSPASSHEAVEAFLAAVEAGGALGGDEEKAVLSAE